MRIVFMGANNTGWLCLEKILSMSENVVGVFTIPKQFKISYASNGVTNVTHRSFEDLAEQANVPLIHVRDSLKQHEKQLFDLAPDVVIVSGWYYKIPSSWLKWPKHGFIGFHPSLLPRYRGGAPLTWAIINGEEKTGMSMFYFTEEMDAGDLIAQKEVRIDVKDTIETLYDKVNHVTLNMIEKTLPLVRNGQSERVKQVEADATYFEQRKPEDGLIDWTKTARQLYDWIRAQTKPYPGAFTFENKNKLMVWSAEVPQAGEIDKPLPPGTVRRVLDGLGVEVCTGDGDLLITSVSLDDKVVSADRVLRAVGQVLGSTDQRDDASYAKPNGENNYV